MAIDGRTLLALQRRLDEFEEVVRAHELKGSKHPEEADFLERDYPRQRKALEKWVAERIMGRDDE